MKREVCETYTLIFAIQVVTRKKKPTDIDPVDVEVIPVQETPAR